MATAEPLTKPIVKAPPDAEKEPIAYLKFHRWRYEKGQTKRADRWYDPTKPEKDLIRRVDKGPITDLAGKPILGLDGQPKRRIETVLTPAAWPLTTDQAIEVQMERDEAARKAEGAK